MKSRWIRFALRAGLFVAVAISLSLLCGAPIGTRTPYQSALVDLVAAPAYAAGCPDKACDHGIQCFASAGFKCIRFNGKGCTATVCG